jgi:hypothetical protein
MDWILIASAWWLAFHLTQPSSHAILLCAKPFCSLATGWAVTVKPSARLGGVWPQLLEARRSFSKQASA